MKELLLVKENKDITIPTKFYVDGDCTGNSLNEELRVGFAVATDASGNVFRTYSGKSLLIQNVTSADTDVLSNNTMEYIALLSLVQQLAYELQYQNKKEYSNVIIYSDSQLVVNQVNGLWSCKEPHLQWRLKELKVWLSVFDSISIVWVPGHKNKASIYLRSLKTK